MASAARFAIVGTLGILCATFAQASPTADPSKRQVRLRTDALRESPFAQYLASHFDGDTTTGRKNDFTDWKSLHHAKHFPSIEGQDYHAVRLDLISSSQHAKLAYLILNATDRQCAVPYNSLATQSAARNANGREYEVFSITRMDSRSVPQRSFSRVFCAPDKAHFDVAFNAAGPRAMPVVISTLSPTDSTQVLNRIVFFLVL